MFDRMRAAVRTSAVPRLTGAASTLAEGAASTDWRGPDLFDGLWHPWPPPLVGGKRRRQLLTQIHARSPFDVRRLYRRTHPNIPKARAVFGSVGLRLHRLTGDEDARVTGLRAVELLHTDTSAGDLGWGYDWDVQTRWGFYPARAPNVVVTAFAVSALLEAQRETGKTEYGERARAAACWALEELWVEPQGFFAYHPTGKVNVHNANLLGAWLVHSALPNHSEARDRARRAVERSLAAQNADGSWPYGEAPNLEWEDSFHTGYVLTCLDRLRSLDAAIDEAVVAGTAPYVRFFDAKGRATLWANRRFPEDAHSSGTGLTTLGMLLRRGLVERDLVERVAERRLTAGIRDGSAVFRRYWWGRSAVRYIRWCDAHVALGLVDAAAALAGEPDYAPRSEAMVRPEA
jgi:hypothetical protein